MYKYFRYTKWRTIRVHFLLCQCAAAAQHKQQHQHLRAITQQPRLSGSVPSCVCAKTGSPESLLSLHGPAAEPNTGHVSGTTQSEWKHGEKSSPLDALTTSGVRIGAALSNGNKFDFVLLLYESEQTLLSLMRILASGSDQLIEHGEALSLLSSLSDHSCCRFVSRQ